MDGVAPLQGIEIVGAKLTSGAVEVVNRNALLTVALSRGYNACLPFYDNGTDLILLNEEIGDTKLVQLRVSGTSCKLGNMLI